MSTFFERTWKPVTGGVQTSSSYNPAATSSNGSNQWYNNLVEFGGKWDERITKYRNMDMTTDITRALDIIGEDISSDNADDDSLFELGFEDDVKEAQLKTINKTLDIWEKKTQFDYKFFNYVREMLKYGIVLFESKSDGSLIKLKTDRIKGYILDKKDEEKVEFYLYDREGAYMTDNGTEIFKPKTQTKSTTEMTVEKIPTKKLLILKISDLPMGESILEKVYRVWKQLQLLEDAVVIYRIVRAPERRVFYIDIGKMPSHKAETYIEKVKNKMRQRQIVNADGAVESNYNPASTQEDFFLAQSGEGRGSRVETLPGGDNLGRIEDMQFFNKKLALAMRIPPSYLDTTAENDSGSQNNDGRLGTAYIAELRYAGYVKRLQKFISKEIFTNFRKFSKKFGTELPEDLEFSIAPPQSFAIYKQNELHSILLNAYSSAEGMESLSKREAMKKYLQMEEDEIVENENAKLLEMGFKEKVITGMKLEVRMNLLYGDGHLSPDEELLTPKKEFEGSGSAEEEVEALPAEEAPKKEPAAPKPEAEKEPAEEK